MIGNFTDEQEQLRAVLRQFLSDRASSDAVRHAMESPGGYDQTTWRLMASQLGLAGLAIPSEFGGAGFSLVELGIALEETGRTLLPSPLFASAGLAAQALVASGDMRAQERWLPGIAAGTHTATVAVSEPGRRWGVDDLATTAVRQDGGWVLSGTKMFVPDGCSADLVLVAARTDDGVSLFAVTNGAPGMIRTELGTLDPTRRLGRIELQTVPAQQLGPLENAASLLSRVLDLAVTALASEQVGGAQACLDAAVEYAKLRVQFGRPIGSFQAIKHKCADLLLAVESARSAAYEAAAVASRSTDDDSSLALSAAVAGAYCSEAYTRSAKESMQIHGGIGYTWEHDAHLYLKRAKTSELLFRSPSAHRNYIAQLARIST